MTARKTVLQRRIFPFVTVTLFSLCDFALSETEMGWTLPKEYRVSDGIAASFADGRRLLVDASGRTVVVKHDGAIIVQLEKSEDLAGLVRVADGDFIVGLALRFNQSKEHLVAAIGARLMLFQVSNGAQLEVKSISSEKILGASWSKKWIVGIQSGRTKSTIKLEVGAWNKKGGATYSWHNVDVKSL
ncbi:MAG: hypothetical protein QOE70_3470 [Chthoniobacter sp.]|nr:hypothetical protein [Chthoniobacter sp.]